MIFSYFCSASIAQLVEHLTLNQQVAGSNPAGCTKKCEIEKRFRILVLYIAIQISNQRAAGSAKGIPMGESGWMHKTPLAAGFYFFNFKSRLQLVNC